MSAQYATAVDVMILADQFKADSRRHCVTYPPPSAVRCNWYRGRDDLESSLCQTDVRRSVCSQGGD